MSTSIKALPTFQSEEWGTITVHRTTYHDGALAVKLTSMVKNTEDGDVFPEPLSTLSVNMTGSTDLPPNCFYAKDWSENEEIAMDAMASGLFKLRHDIKPVRSGYIIAEAWEIL